MAATGKTPILLYGSTTPTNQPSAGNLTNSSDGCEIAINVADKNLFFKDATNTVNTVPIRQSSASSNGWLSSTDWSTFNSKGSGSVTSVSGTGTVNGLTLTGTVTTSGSLTLGGTLSNVANSALTNSSITFGSTAQALGSTVSALNGVSVGQSSAAAGTFTTLTNTNGGSLAGDFTVGGSAYPSFKASAGNAAYIKIDDTANTGGKLWRIGDGVYAFGTLSIYNQTDNTFPLSIIGSTGNVNVEIGNLVIGTSGKGIDFSATAGTGTSELLADYEEGTWTATDASGAGLTLNSVNATYTKIGNLVTVYAFVIYPSTVDTSAAKIGGLPYTVNSTFTYPPGSIMPSSGIALGCLAENGTTTISIKDPTNYSTARTNALISGAGILLSLTYHV